jgi:chromosome segregation ATPase
VPSLHSQKSGKSVLALTIAIASMIFAALLTAHAYQLHLNYVALKEENEKLSERCALLTSEKVRLAEALENLNRTLLALSENYSSLREQYKALNESYTTLKSDHALLSEQYKALNGVLGIEKASSLASSSSSPVVS